MYLYLIMHTDVQNFIFRVRKKSTCVPKAHQKIQLCLLPNLILVELKIPNPCLHFLISLDHSSHLIWASWALNNSVVPWKSTCLLLEYWFGNKNVLSRIFLWFLEKCRSETSERWDCHNSLKKSNIIKIKCLVWIGKLHSENCSLFYLSFWGFFGLFLIFIDAAALFVWSTNHVHFALFDTNLEKWKFMFLLRFWTLTA